MIGFERVTANQFRQMLHLVRGRKFLRLHFKKMNRMATTQKLPCRFTASQSAADDDDVSNPIHLTCFYVFF